MSTEPSLVEMVHIRKVEAADRSCELHHGLNDISVNYIVNYYAF